MSFVEVVDSNEVIWREVENRVRADEAAAAAERRRKG